MDQFLDGEDDSIFDLEANCSPKQCHQHLAGSSGHRLSLTQSSRLLYSHIPPNERTDRLMRFCATMIST